MRGLAMRSGLCSETCSLILNGHHLTPSVHTISRMARALNISTDTFLDVLEVYVWKPKALHPRGKPKSPADAAPIAR